MMVVGWLDDGRRVVRWWLSGGWMMVVGWLDDGRRVVG